MVLFFVNAKYERAIKCEARTCVHISGDLIMKYRLLYRFHVFSTVFFFAIFRITFMFPTLALRYLAYLAENIPLRPLKRIHYFEGPPLKTGGDLWRIDADSISHANWN